MRDVFQGQDQGSSFHSTFGREGTSPNDDELHAYSHHAVAAYIPDISISMEWGISWHENYDAGWVHKFPTPHAVGRYLDIFYNHSLVHRVAFVEVDGEKMPNPNNVVDLKVPKGVCDLLKVIESRSSTASVIQQTRS